MKRSNKVLLGGATFWPILYIFVLAGFIIAFKVLLRDDEPSIAVGDAMSALAILLFAVAILTVLLSLGLSVYYLVHAIKREDMKRDMKIGWAILFLFFGIFAQPVYWYMHIWKEPEFATHTPEQLYAANTADWVRPEETRRQGEYVPPNEPPDWR